MSARDTFEPAGSAPHLCNHPAWKLYRRIREHVWKCEWRARGCPEYDRQDDDDMIDQYLRAHCDELLGTLKYLYLEDVQFRKGDS